MSSVVSSRLLVSLALAALATACAHSAGPAPAAKSGAPSAFPTREALAAVSQQPKPELTKAEPYVDVREWKLTGPFPDGRAREPLTGDEPWTQALRTAVAPRAGVTLATQAMQCAARQLAQFVAEHGQLPSPSLRSYLAARCGATVVGLSARWVTGTAPTTQTDAQIFTAWQAQIAPMFAELPPGNSDVGVWLARRGEDVAVLRVDGRRSILVSSLGPDAGGPAIQVLRAELLEPAAAVRVMVNRGRFGFAECATTYHAPTLEARCPVDTGDASAWIAVAAFPAGRVLGHTALEALVWPAGAPVDTYSRVDFPGDAVATPGAPLAPVVLATINGIRQQAGMAALVDEAEQSTTAAGVAPYYFASQQHLMPETVADVVALGLRAGWQVGGLVQRGQFTAPSTLGTDKVADLIALSIERPFGRETLFDPTAQRVSVGAVWEPQSKFMGAVITTYSLLDEPTAALTEAVWARITAARATAGHPPPTRDDRFETKVAAVRQRLMSHETDADTTLQDLMASYSNGVQAFWVEIEDPTEMEVPPAILGATRPRVAVVVARHRRPDAPWGRYVAFVLLEGPPVTNI